MGPKFWQGLEVGLTWRRRGAAMGGSLRWRGAGPEQAASEPGPEHSWPKAGAFSRTAYCTPATQPLSSQSCAAGDLFPPGASPRPAWGDSVRRQCGGTSLHLLCSPAGTPQRGEWKTPPCMNNMPSPLLFWRAQSTQQTGYSSPQPLPEAKSGFDPLPLNNSPSLFFLIDEEMTAQSNWSLGVGCVGVTGRRQGRADSVRVLYADR